MTFFKSFYLICEGYFHDKLLTGVKFSVGPISEGSVTIPSFNLTSKTPDNAGKAQDAPFTFIVIAS